MEKRQSVQTENNDSKTKSQKLEKEHMKNVSGGSYTPDTEEKDDDIVLPEI